MSTPQELADALTIRIRETVTVLRTPLDQEANRAAAEAALDRLEAGIGLANALLESETDAGRTAVAQYRELDSAITRANDVLFAGGAALSNVAAGRPSGITPETPKLLTSAFWSGSGPILIGGAVAIGLGWWLLSKAEKKSNA